ncbi:DNA-directed RNA polymerase, partial [Coemansia furcata]
MLVRKYYQPVAGWFDVRGDDIDVVYYADKYNDPPFTTQTLDIDDQELGSHVYKSNEALLLPRFPSGLVSRENRDIPMFLVKATYLESNSAMTLGVTYHHSLMDGTAFWTFMNNWACLCKQLHDQVCPGSVPPIPNPPSFGFPNISHLHKPDLQFDHSEYALVKSSDFTRVFLSGKDIIKENFLVISVEQQHELRRMAREFGVSFNTILCAIFWKETSVLRYNARPSTAQDMSLFTCATNPRTQLGLSKNLCASPVINLAALRPIGEIAAMELRDVALLVSQTVSKGSPEYIYSSTNYLLAQRRKEVSNEELGIAGDKLMLVYVCPAYAKCVISSSRNFPIYQSDFGFGSPEYVRPPYLPFDGCMRIWPTPQSAGGGAVNSEAPLEIYVSQPDYVDFTKSPLLAIMSQLMLRALRSHTRTAGTWILRSNTYTAPRTPVRLAHLQLPVAKTTQARFFTQQPWLRQSVHAEAEQPGHVLDEDSTLFASTTKDLISMRDMREDTELVHYMQTGKTLAEQLSVMQACLLNGNVERAQRILIGLYRLYPETMKEAADVSVHNEIIGGLLAAKPRPLTTEALLWYDQMERHYHIKPNTNTFAILISGFVNGGMRNVAVVLMQEMLRCGHTFHDLLLSTYLSDTDIDHIKDVARGIISQGLESSDVAANLLNAVNDAEEKLESLSATADQVVGDTDLPGITPMDALDTKLNPAETVSEAEANTLVSTNVE